MQLAYLTIRELSELIVRKEISPIEVVEAYLGRATKLNQKTNAFIAFAEEQALDAARAAENAIASGRWLGPLHGVPIGIKDLYDVTGMQTTAGSRVLASNNSRQQDSTTVARLRASGAIFLGKTNVHEFAYGATNESSHFGLVRNPWDLARISGGSSGGSGAALAAGMVAGALGSDTGGSIRIPAAACGVVGLKPTFGRVSRQGVIPLSWSLDHTGPMARSVEDVMIILKTIEGYDPLDRASVKKLVGKEFFPTLKNGIRNARLALATHSYDLIDPEVKDIFDTAVAVLEELGANVEKVSVSDVQKGFVAWNTIMLAEASAYHEPFLKQKASEYSEEVLVQLEAGKLITATQYLKAQQFRTIFNQQIDFLMSRFDALLCPTLPVKAPLIGQKYLELEGKRLTTQDAMTHFNWLGNLTGLPAVSVPCGFTSDGLPIGLMLMGNSFSETDLMQVAGAYEAITPWHKRHPTL